MGLTQELPAGIQQQVEAVAAACAGGGCTAEMAELAQAAAEAGLDVDAVVLAVVNVVQQTPGVARASVAAAAAAAASAPGVSTATAGNLSQVAAAASTDDDAVDTAASAG